MAPHNHDPKDYIVGDDFEIGLADEPRPETLIQRLYLSGGNSHSLTTTIPKSWCYRMNLHPKDYIFMELNSDGNELRIKKVSTQKFKKDESKAAAVLLPVDSDAAAEAAEIAKEKSEIER